MTPTTLARRAPVATWEARAACQADAGLFLPALGSESHDARLERERAAKKVCTECPVRDECLAYALRVGEALGVWGGMTEPERRRHQRRLGPDLRGRGLAGLTRT